MSALVVSEEAKKSTPLFLSCVQAGFPSPAADYADDQLDFNELLIQRPASTYCLRVSGLSMRDAGILPDDIIVVDRSLRPASGDIVVASLEGEFTVKRFLRRGQSAWLHPENPDFPDIPLHVQSEVSFFGVVTGVVRRCGRGGQSHADRIGRL